MSIRAVERMNIIPVLSPHDLVNATHRTSYVDLDLAHWVSFVVQYGALTSNASSDNVVFTVEASSIASSAGATAIPFTYRLSSAIDTNSWGTITAGTSDGVTFSTSDLVNSAVVIDVNPEILNARGEKYRWVTVVLAPGTSLAAVGGVVAYVEPRYPGATIPSSS